MRTLKIMYRLFRIFSIIYMMLKAVRAGRFLTVGIALFRLLRTRRVTRDAKRMADFAFITAGDPAIYRRRGVRRMTSRRG